MRGSETKDDTALFKKVSYNANHILIKKTGSNCEVGIFKG